MKFSISKKRAVLAIALSSAVGAAAFAGIAGTAKADPMQYNALAGVGSDTVQDIANAFAGFTNGVDYTPLHSSSASGYKQIVSFDAITPGTSAGVDCITSQINGPAYLRPNGSGAGQKALSRAMDGTGWGATPTCGVQDVSGQIQFSRSSSAPSSAGDGSLTFIPIGRDGVSFAYYQADTTDQTNHPTVTSLTRKQLIDLFSATDSTAGITVNGTRLIACGIQLDSGTDKFWKKALNSLSSPTEATATTFCNGKFPSNGLSGRSEENNSFSLKSRGDAVNGTTGHQYDEVVIGFSAASFAAKYNGAAPCGSVTCTPTIATGVGMGSISDDSLTSGGTNLGNPLSLVDSKQTPNSTFFNSSTFGRLVFFVVPTAVINSAGQTNLDIKSLFKGSSSAMCLATATINKFGFLTSSECGDTTTYTQGKSSGQS